MKRKELLDLSSYRAMRDYLTYVVIPITRVDAREALLGTIDILDGLKEIDNLDNLILSLVNVLKNLRSI